MVARLQKKTIYLPTGTQSKILGKTVRLDGVGDARAGWGVGQPKGTLGGQFWPGLSLHNKGD